MSHSIFPGLPGYDPDNIQPWFAKVMIVMALLALGAVLLRLWSRRLQGQRLWWDDWIIMFSWLWAMSLVGVGFAQAASGMGTHADLVDPKNIRSMARYWIITNILYAFNLAWIKLSLLLMYYRIFRIPFFKLMSWIVGSFVIIWSICVLFLSIFACTPMQKAYSPDLPGRCNNHRAVWAVHSTFTTLTDIIILVMPIVKLWSLRLKTTEKIGLTVAFSLGFFVVFTSIYRSIVILRDYNELDASYTLAPAMGWSAIELGSAIISACLPILMPVVKFLFRHLGIYSLFKALRRAIRKHGQTKLHETAGLRPNRVMISSYNDKKSGNAIFHEHADQIGSGDVTRQEVYQMPSMPSNAKLRSDLEHHGQTTTCSTHDRSEESDDEVPLRGIRVQRAFERATTEGIK